MGNIDKGAIIQVRCSFQGDAPELGIATPQPQWGKSQKLRLTKEKGSRVVSARAHGNSVSLIVLAGDIPGNFMESVSFGGRPITIKGRVTDDYIKPGLD